MTGIAEKVKEKAKEAKDKVLDVKDKAKDKTVGGGGDTDTSSRRGYEANEPMSPEKITEHEPTAVKREMTEDIGKTGSEDPERAKEIARRSGMAKGTAGAAEEETENI